MGRMKRQDIFLLNGRQHGFCSLASRVLFPFFSPSLLLFFLPLFQLTVKQMIQLILIVSAVVAHLFLWSSSEV